MTLSFLHTQHIFAAVQCMYRWSERLHNEPNLPTTAEEWDFYMGYLGGGPI